MNAAAPTVGVIGLGAMGRPMAVNLHRAGHLKAVWNRTATKAAALADELGVELAADPTDLARRCDVVLTSVSRDADVLEVIDALLPGLQPAAVVVDTSTVSAATAQIAAGRLAAAQARFLDAPVSGGVEGARGGTLVMMVGGDSAIVQAVEPLLGAVASRITHMGPTGSGQATKAVNQLMVAGINQAVTEALAFGEALGLPMARVVDVLAGGAAGSWFLTHRGNSMLQGEFQPGFKLELHAKDLSICRDMVAQLGVGEGRLPLVEMTLIHYRRLMEAGYGAEDISALYRLKRALFLTAGES